MTGGEGSCQPDHTLWVMNSAIDINSLVVEGSKRALPELRAQYVERLAMIPGTVSKLRQVAAILIGRGVKRETLVRWGLESGYSPSYMRALVSRLLCGLATRRRRRPKGIPALEATTTPHPAVNARRSRPQQQEFALLPWLRFWALLD